MPIIEVSAIEEVSIPEGSEIVLAPTGVVAGIRLPNGEFLKPWINWELFANSDEGGDAIGDLDENELNLRDIHTGLDFERIIAVKDGDVSVDARAVKSN
jgi:hypothetical protein